MVAVFIGNFITHSVFMRKYYVLLFMGIALFLASCRKDPATLSLTVQPKWGSDNLQLNTTYSSTGGYMNFSSFGMYLSHIKLVKADNSEVEVDSMALINYANNAIKIDLKAVEGSYKGIKFGIGLDSAQNAISPAQVDDQSAYKPDVLYWAQGLDHLFIAMEGHSGSTSSLGNIFFYHIGTNAMYRTTEVDQPFSVAAGGSTSLTLDADISKVFSGANGVNVLTQPGTHSTDSVAIAVKVADNFTQIFTLQ